MSQNPPGSGRPNPNLVEMGTSYSVEVLGRTGLRYIEGDKTMLIDSEALATPNTIALNAGSVKRWAPPREAEPVSDQDRKRIVENIQRAFDTRGWVVSVTWPFGDLQPDGTWQWST
jgi:hypothetical protein